MHYFCTLAQTGSLTKASELLNISQPALSKAIKTLEGEVGQALIVPSGRGVAITDYGRRLAEESRPILEKLWSLKKLDVSMESSDILRIVTFEIFSTYFASTLITEEFSKIQISLHEKNPGEIEESIAKDRADIGITFIPVPRPEVDIIKVGEMGMGIYGRPKFLKTSFDSLPFVVPIDEALGSPIKARAIDGFPDDKIQRLIKNRVTLMETGLQLCGLGENVGYFPHFIVQAYNKNRTENVQLHSLPNPENLNRKSFDIFLIKRKTDMETSHFKKVARQLRKLR